VTIKQKFSVSVKKTFVDHYTVQHLKVLSQNGKTSFLVKLLNSSDENFLPIEYTMTD